MAHRYTDLFVMQFTQRVPMLLFEKWCNVKQMTLFHLCFFQNASDENLKNARLIRMRFKHAKKHLNRLFKWSWILSPYERGIGQRHYVGDIVLLDIHSCYPLLQCIISPQDILHDFLPICSPKLHFELLNITCEWKTSVYKICRSLSKMIARRQVGVIFRTRW